MGPGGSAPQRLCSVSGARSKFVDVFVNPVPRGRSHHPIAEQMTGAARHALCFFPLQAPGEAIGEYSD